MLKQTVVTIAAILTFQLGAASCFLQECESGNVNVLKEFVKGGHKFNESVTHLAEVKQEVFERAKKCRHANPLHLRDLQATFREEMSKCNHKLTSENATIHKEIEKVTKLMTEMHCSKSVVAPTKRPVHRFNDALQHLHHFIDGLKDGVHKLFSHLKHFSVDKLWMELIHPVLSAISHQMHPLLVPAFDQHSCKKHNSADCKKIAAHIHKIVGSISKASAGFDKCVKEKKEHIYKHHTFKAMCP